MTAGNLFPEQKQSSREDWHHSGGYASELQPVCLLRANQGQMVDIQGLAAAGTMCRACMRGGIEERGRGRGCAPPAAGRRGAGGRRRRCRARSPPQRSRPRAAAPRPRPGPPLRAPIQDGEAAQIMMLIIMISKISTLWGGIARIHEGHRACADVVATSSMTRSVKRPRAAKQAFQSSMTAVYRFPILFEAPPLASKACAAVRIRGR